MGKKAKIQLSIYTDADYACTNTYAIVAPATGPILSIPAPKSGWYRYNVEGVVDIGGTSNYGYFQMGKNTIKFGMEQRFTTSATLYTAFNKNNRIYLKKNDVLSLYAKYIGSASVSVEAGASITLVED